jgi:hypothetical protein
MGTKSCAYLADTDANYVLEFSIVVTFLIILALTEEKF